MKIKSIKKIEPKPAKCIEVDSPDRLFAVGGESGDAVLTHNSVVQRNVLFSAIMRPEHWKVVAIDLKKVELSSYRAYSNVVIGVATELEDALTVLRYSQQIMMRRYAEMEELGINNFLDLAEATGGGDADGGGNGEALMVMVDELGELISPSGGKALSEHTVLPLPNGEYATLGELEIGDEVLDIYEEPTTITNKYFPEDQRQYSLKIRRDETDEKEDFIAGTEHWWVAVIEEPDGYRHPEQLMMTEDLYKFKKGQELLPEEERAEIKFRKYKKKS